MNRFHKFLALAALTPFLAACAPSNEDVCNHITELLKEEVGAIEGAKAPSDEEVKKYNEQCVTDLEKEKQKKGPEVFGKQVKCIMAATKMEELMKCEEEVEKGEEGDKKAE